MFKSLSRITFLLIFGTIGAVEARASFPTIALKAVSLGELQAPVNISHAGDGSGRLFICDQRGKIRIIQNGMLLPTPFLDITAKVIALNAGYDERGLLGLAFHPGYSNPVSPGFGRFYVFYSAPSPNFPGTATDPVDCRTTISEFRVSADPNMADPLTERILLTFDKPQFNHNGGQLVFGPEPGGYLYISVGDGGDADDNNFGHTGGSDLRPPGALGNGQDKTRLLGKLLRIDPLGSNGPGGQYGIPPTNPFAASVGIERKEIFAYGLRNPWRASFDDGPGGTGRLFVADVGQNKVEEINIVVAGGNYGWRAKEGNYDFDPLVPTLGETLLTPIAEYAHPGVVVSPPLPQLGISICGGYLYRGSAISGLVGKYIFGDFGQNFATATGSVLGIEETSPGVWTVPARLTVIGGNPFPARLLAMGRDEAGEIYLATETLLGPQGATGGIYKIVPEATGAVALNPVKDNTIFSESGSTSSALGSLFAGRVASLTAVRRALLAFDINANVPAGSTIDTATLTLTLNNVGPAVANNMPLYRLTENWGEGTSSGSGSGAPATPGDATWTQRFYDATTPVNWTTAGGTFSGTVSATTNVTSVLGPFSWTSAQLATDVKNWLATPATNFGWILTADETITASPTAHGFVSREGAAAQRPQLQINYSGAALTRREFWLRQYFTAGKFVDDAADLDGDGIANLIEYAFGFSPLAQNPPGAGFQVSIAPAGANTTLTLTFRRDPRAVDLTYMLQTSSDLINWTTIAQSSGGAVPSGTGFVSESDVAGESPIKLVVAQETITAAQGQRFARLQVSH
ncbi:hypothetical protein AYO41_01130 [Verrucomicrobia bacterium SCGC AG-212-E04]|nr:hypothetical protein AYO41_01130 [Verrucomicrobia bacterium SCGC AG-212-E04]